MIKYIEEPSKPFSNGMEYMVFTDNFCDRCKKGMWHDDMFPEYPENGGCPVWDAMERSRFDKSVFPIEDIVRLTDKDGAEQYSHVCKHFLSEDIEVMESYRCTFEIVEP